MIIDKYKIPKSKLKVSCHATVFTKGCHDRLKFWSNGSNTRRDSN